MTARAKKGLPGHDRLDMTAKPGQDSQDRTARKKAGGTTRTGQNWTDKRNRQPRHTGEDMQYKTGRTRLLGKNCQDNCQDRTVRTELSGQNCQDKTVNTGLAGQESQNRTARTKQTENDRQNKAARTRQPEQVSQNSFICDITLIIWRCR
jgi:hypothetical protein